MNHGLLFSVSHQHRNSGPHRLASFLRENNWDVEVVDFALKWQLDELKELIKSRVTPDTKFIGFSIFWSGWNQLMEDFSSWIKSCYPNVLTILGGYGGSEVFSKNIDYYIHGYGEYAVLALLNNEKVILDHRFFGEKKVIDAIHSYPSYPMKSLRISYEYRDFLDSKEWLTLEFSRGCKFKCDFCNFPVLGVKGDYTRTAKDFEIEVKENYDKWGIKNYYVADETFNDYTEKIIKYANIVEQLDFRPFFSGFIRADLLVSRPEDREHLARMNFGGHAYGIETFNHKSGKTIGKGMHPEKLQQGLIEIKNYFRSAGLYRGTISLIAGLPHETVTTLNKSKQWLLDNWQGEHATMLPLQIPKISKTIKPSLISENFEKYGFSIDDNTTNFDANNYYMKRLHLADIPGSNGLINWKNSNMSFSDAIRYAYEMHEQFMSDNTKFTTTMWSLGDYAWADLDLKGALKIPLSDEKSCNVINVAWDNKDAMISNYIEKKLSQ